MYNQYLSLDFNLADEDEFFFQLYRFMGQQKFAAALYQEKAYYDLVKNKIIFWYDKRFWDLWL